MADRRIAKLFLLLACIWAVAACNLGIQLPDYFIDVRTKDLKLAYDNGSGIEVEYKFIAELEQHRCEYALTNGSEIELERKLTGFVDSGQWQSLLFDVPAEGKYTVRIIVQSETADGHFVDMNFLDKAVVFYFDRTSPGSATISPTPSVSGRPLSIVLSHPDDLDPDASPVTLYYTVDGSDPTPSSLAYAGGLQIGISETPVELKVLPVDSVNLPGPIEAVTYHFMDIQDVSPSNISTSPSIQGIYIYGFGSPM